MNAISPMKSMLARSLLVCLLPMLSVTALAQTAQPLDRIAAVVDESVILRSELDRAVANIRSQYAGRENQLPPPDVLERQVMERLVLVRLQVAKAEETGVRITDEEVEQAIAGIAQQNGTTVEQLRARVTSDGSSVADFRRSVRDEITIQRLRQRFAQTRVNVSEAEIDAAVAATANTGTQYHLAHILVALPEGATPEQIATAEKKINGVKGLLDRNEMDFTAAAARYSDSQNALEGGDLGWRGADEIPAAFARLVRDLQPGQVTAPLRGPSGFQLLKLVETRDAAQAAPQMVTEYNARHILVRVDETTPDDKARARIDTLAARIKGGANFADLARNESGDQGSASKGGDLGWFPADRFGPEFSQSVTSLQDNQVSAPFRTQAGWHIVQRIGARQTNATDANKRAQVAETIGRRKLEDEWSRYLQELRGDAFVDVRGATASTDATAPAATTPATPTPTPAPAPTRPAPASGG